MNVQLPTQLGMGMGAGKMGAGKASEKGYRGTGVWKVRSQGQ